MEALLSFESKANSTECYVEKKTRSMFRGKCFANSETKAQIYEFGDDETEIDFIDVTRSPCVELLLFARKE